MVVSCEHVKNSKNRPLGHGFVNYSNPHEGQVLPGSVVFFLRNQAMHDMTM